MSRRIDLHNLTQDDIDHLKVNGKTAELAKARKFVEMKRLKAEAQAQAQAQAPAGEPKPEK